MTAVGVIGLGTMGSRLADRLLAAGYEVHGTNRTPDRAQELIDGGLHWHDTPRDVARTVDVVISMVTDDAALDAIAAGSDGILAGLSPTSIYMDMSSVSPQASERVARQVHAAGARMLDAPVSGSTPQAEQGTLTIMVGGDEATFHEVEPLLGHLAQTLIRVGDNGAGVLLKLAINISLAVQALAFSEGLVLAERGGIDPKLAAQVMSSSPIGSPMLKARVPLLLELPETAWFPMRLMRKDIRLALAEAHRADLALPTTQAVAAVLDQVSELGYDERDIAGFRELLANVSPVPGAEFPT